jgi:adenine-specific DNA-methyltransferase
MGSVTEELATKRPVLANDSLAFACCIARARFTDCPRAAWGDLKPVFQERFLEASASLREQFAERLATERSATEDREKMDIWIREAPHVGASRQLRTDALTVATESGIARYRLATTYFSASYFSTAQAIELDALRWAIESVDLELRDWLLAAWLATASRLINAPGHTAQFLRPTSDVAWSRLRLRWGKSAFTTFEERLGAIERVGSERWRRETRVTNTDALQLTREDVFDDVKVVYADPPYTKDHYSRFYHVLETLYLYDFPTSSGVGRYRDTRASSGFSLASRVEGTFRSLLGSLRDRRCALVLSYPSSGLLSTQGIDVRDLLAEFFEVHRVIEVSTTHSTFGASDGAVRKAATERIYVCRYSRRHAKAA